MSAVTFGVPKKVHEKVWEVPFSVDGKAVAYPLKYWDSAPFKDKVVEGATVPVEVEKKPNKNKPDVIEHWLKAVDGVGEKRGGGFGGGKSNYVPKTREEFHSSCVAGIIKSCLDNSVVDPKLMNEILDKVYWPQIGKAS